MPLLEKRLKSLFNNHPELTHAYGVYRFKRAGDQKEVSRLYRTQCAIAKSSVMSKLFLVRTANQCLRDASKTPAPKMLFDQLWFEREICIFFTDSNLGKTVLAFQIADSIASGRPIKEFSLDAKAQKVLYCDFELSDKQFEGRYSEEYEEHFVFSDNLFRLMFSPDLTEFRITEKMFFDEIKQELLEKDIKVSVIDNISFLSRDALENAKEANDLMKVIKQLKNELGLSILIIAHTPKIPKNKVLTRGDLAGSAGLSRFTDSMFAMGTSSLDDKTRYIKQLKVRSAEMKYGANNVITISIEKQENELKKVMT